MSIFPNWSQFYKTQGGSLEWDHPTYVEREADRDFYQKLKNGEFCYVFNARQMGKSSLKNRTMYKLQQEGVACASIDLTGIGGNNKEEWYKSIVDELTRWFNLKFNQRAWWRNHQGLSFSYCFNLFLKEVLLAELSQPIVIFLDEIDSVISLDFQSDDFFALIRSCHEKRTNTPEYKRLTFALLGVTTPSDLIQDKFCTPFNIGKEIELTGFSFDEIQLKLARGLEEKVDNPGQVLRRIWEWTRGQPFLTQKLCGLVAQNAENRNPNISQFVEQYVINNWERQDNPEHLRTIRDRLLDRDRLHDNESKIWQLLGIYKQIIDLEKIKVNSNREQTELQLSGLVTQEEGYLRIANLIYQRIFNQDWVEKRLNNLRPYAAKMTDWISSQDRSFLLDGDELKKALIWSEDKSLNPDDRKFLKESESYESDYQLLQNCRISEPNAVRNAIYWWTNGQKNLTDKIFSRILDTSRMPEIDNEEDWITKSVRSHLINDWETSEDAGHLRKIRDRILNIEESDRFWMLILYRRILQNEEVEIDETDYDLLHLLDLGLVVKRSQKFTIANRIYQEVFNVAWVETMLPNVKFYSQQLVAWLNSKEQDPSQLLYGQELQNALEYIKNKNFPKLRDKENRFLIRSQISNQLNISKSLEQIQKPYSTKFAAWKKSNGRDRSQLLLGHELEEALEWASQHKLSKKEHKFLIRSQILNQQGG